MMRSEQILRHVILRHVIPRHVIPRHVIPRHVILRHVIPRHVIVRLAAVLPIVATGVVAGCSTSRGEESPVVSDTAVTAVNDGALPAADTAVGRPAVDSAAPAPKLSPVADSIAQRMVFPPIMQRWFVAAARGKRLLVDLGRVDLEIKKGSAREAEFSRAAEVRTPVPVGTRVRLRGDWGSEEATISGFTHWNGRIAATLEGSPLVDSLARVRDQLVVSAERVSDSLPATPSSCDRSGDSTTVVLLARVANEALDSLKAGEQPIYARLRNGLKSKVSVAPGCFGEAKGIAIATLWAGDYEWVRERVLLVSDSLSKPRRLTVRDLRFRAHEALHAVDADGDGVDDLAARAWTPRGGGTVLLVLREGRLERLAQGFAYER